MRKLFFSWKRPTKLGKLSECNGPHLTLPWLGCFLLFATLVWNTPKRLVSYGLTQFRSLISQHSVKSSCLEVHALRAFRERYASSLRRARQALPVREPEPRPAESALSLWQFQFRRVASHNVSASKCNKRDRTNSISERLREQLPVQRERESERASARVGVSFKCV